MQVQKVDCHFKCNFIYIELSHDASFTNNSEFYNFFIDKLSMFYLWTI